MLPFGRAFRAALRVTAGAAMVTRATAVSVDGKAIPGAVAKRTAPPLLSAEAVADLIFRAAG